MNEDNELVIIEKKPMQREPRNKKRSGWGQSIASGVIGSLLTASIFVVTGDQLFKDDSSESTTNATAVESVKQSSKSEPVENTTYTATTTGSIADMVESASKAIVGVVNYAKSTNRFSSQSTTEEESGSGSGVMYKVDGNNAYIVTNNHVIEGASKIEVILDDGEKATAELVGADALTDLAVLKIDASIAPEAIKFGDSSTTRSGEQVIAIGNPLGLDLSKTVTQGIVSATGRSIEVETTSGVWELDVIQTDAAINPGNSGGALINTSGEVIGINSLKISEEGVEGLGFAIPSNDLIPIVDEIIQTGKIVRPYLGVGLANLEELPQNYIQNISEDVDAGVMVTNIATGSGAATAGFQVQDIITSINGTAITSASELRKFLYTKADIGDKVAFEVYRGNEKMTLNVTLTGTP